MAADIAEVEMAAGAEMAAEAEETIETTDAKNQRWQ